MPSISRRLALLATLIVLGPAAGNAAVDPHSTPVLVADFAPGSGPGALAPRRFATAGGRILFVNNDRFGEELWESDGTDAGTRLLADLCPGVCSSDPEFFTELGDQVLFFGHLEEADLDRGIATLFSLRGDRIETLGRLPGSPQVVRVLGSQVYFSLGSAAGDILYRSDGTALGTVPATEVCAGAEPCRVRYGFFVSGEAIYYVSPEKTFHAYFPASGERRSLGAMDGIYELTRLDAERAVFIGSPAPYIFQPWVTDGTAAGTFALATESVTSQNSVSWQGRYYWRKPNGSWVSSDGTVAGIRDESLLLPGGSSLFHVAPDQLLYVRQGSLWSRGIAGGPAMLMSQAFDLIAWGHLGGKLVFSQGGERLMITDGTPGGTRSLLEGRGHYVKGAVANGQLYFGFSLASAPLSGYGLYRSDGTADGTLRLEVATLPQPYSSETRLHPADDAMIFAEVSPQTGGSQQWQIDPETLASELYRNPTVVIEASRNGLVLGSDWANGFRPVAIRADQDVALASFNASRPAISDDRRAYFTDSATGRELWESDGTAEGTRKVLDFNFGYAQPVKPTQITPSGGNVFFVGVGPQPNRYALWSYRRGAAAAERLKDLGTAFLLLGKAPGGAVAFELPSATVADGRTLWTSDGTAAGTRPLLELPLSEGSVLHAAVAGPRFFFTLTSESDDCILGAPCGNPELIAGSLWVSDLTVSGTVRLSGPEGPAIRSLVASGDRVYFNGYSPEHGAELGVSDGTVAGTGRLELEPGPRGSSPRHLFDLGDGRLAFAAAARGDGAELWITDGTAAGTFALADLAPGPASSMPNGFALVGSRLFFQADDGTTGEELWALDLPPRLPPCPHNRLCLRDGRFEVGVEVETGGAKHQGQRVLGAAEAGVFSFFSGDNWEMLVKVLDGCAIDDSFWVYASAATDLEYELTVHDRWSGLTKTYPWAGGPAPPILDGGAFATCQSPALPPAVAPPADNTEPAARCADDPATLCLGPQGRYRVRLDWQTADAEGQAQPVENGSGDSGLFTFFSPGNWEMMVKVLDGCAINGKRWVFAAGTTDVGWKMVVVDRLTGATQIYRNTLGTASKTVTDSAAFSCD